jgi:hypothetical protein
MNPGLRSWCPVSAAGALPVPMVYCLRVRVCRCGCNRPPEYIAPDRFSAIGRPASASARTGHQETYTTSTSQHPASDPRPNGLAARDVQVRPPPVESSTTVDRDGASPRMLRSVQSVCDRRLAGGLESFRSLAEASESSQSWEQFCASLLRQRVSDLTLATQSWRTLRKAGLASLYPLSSPPLLVPSRVGLPHLAMQDIGPATWRQISTLPDITSLIFAVRPCATTLTQLP